MYRKIEVSEVIISGENVLIQMVLINSVLYSVPVYSTSLNTKCSLSIITFNKSGNNSFQLERRLK